MKKATTLLLALFVFTAVGCGDSHDAVADDMVGLMEDMLEILESVDDKESAEAANGKFKDLAEDAKELGERMEELGKPDKDIEKELEDKYSDEVKELQKKIEAEIKRITKKDASLPLEFLPGMRDLGEAMKDVDGLK